jgi:hypothetical protein
MSEVLFWVVAVCRRRQGLHCTSWLAQCRCSLHAGVLDGWHAIVAALADYNVPFLLLSFYQDSRYNYELCVSLLAARGRCPP